MANDRIYIVCLTCEGKLCISKYYPGSLQLFYPPGTLDTWFEEHLKHLEEVNYGGDLNGIPGFAFATDDTIQEIVEKVKVESNVRQR